ncbi:serotriflin-like isoform X2 [Hyla sarda]|uniref:serotriflin-like isoform X2 n=1 Tax=Hyla sarda TaxID=327740 RepID=UPI0024C3A923|nr:serotriflin-like isoform X2 [Hyla sarda]
MQGLWRKSHLAKLNQKEAYKKHLCEHAHIRKYIVDRHNELRGQVKPAPNNMLKMEWNDQAAKTALNVANKCEHAHSKADERQTDTFSCGENLYMSNRPYNWTRVIQSWYDEKKDFEHGVGAKSEDAIVGHYTQLVWYKSFQLGCALSYCPKQNLGYFYVCHYCPAGNMKNSLHAPYEAGDTCGKCKHACNNGLCENPCMYDDDVEGCAEYMEFCESEEEDMDEEFKIKNICQETCNCDDEII